MVEVYQHAFSSANAVYSILLIVVLAYWLMVIVGVLDFDLFHFDVDHGLDLDHGLDVDGGDIHAGDVGDAGGASLLAFFNMGEVPIMFYASLIVLEMWLISMKFTDWFGEDRPWLAWLLIIPNFVFCLLFTKFLLEPVKWYTRRVYPKSSLVGKTCVITSLEANEKFGRCEVATDSSPILVNVRTENGEVLQKGEAAVVVKYVPEDHFHIVTKQTWE